MIGKAGGLGGRRILVPETCVILQGFEKERAKEPNGNHEATEQKTINMAMFQPSLASRKARQISFSTVRSTSVQGFGGEIQQELPSIYISFMDLLYQIGFTWLLEHIETPYSVNF